MNFELLKEKFENIPDLDCSFCGKGIFVHNKDEYIFKETGLSRISKGYGSDDFQYWSDRFVITSECSNPDCKEPCFITGITSYEEDGWFEGGYNEAGEEIQPHPKYKKFFQIRMMDPPLKLFKYSNEISAELNNKLSESFGLFWLDKSACGNKIRTAIEILLNDLGVRKTYTTKKGKRWYYKLHDRIALYSKKKPKIAEKLFAIKWIGNDGSHGISELSNDEIISAYKILEYVLKKLYDKSENEVNRLTKKINKKYKK